MSKTTPSSRDPVAGVVQTEASFANRPEYLALQGSISGPREKGAGSHVGLTPEETDGTLRLLPGRHVEWRRKEIQEAPGSSLKSRI